MTVFKLIMAFAVIANCFALAIVASYFMSIGLTFACTLMLISALIIGLCGFIALGTDA